MKFTAGVLTGVAGCWGLFRFVRSEHFDNLLEWLDGPTLEPPGPAYTVFSDGGRHVGA